MKRSKLVLAGAIAAIVIAAILLGSRLVRPECTQLTGRDTIVLPASALTRGVARFFCYRDNSGERVRFLLARDSDGGVHGVFDACRQCYKFNKGYKISAGYMVCRLCGNRYKITEMQAGKASCVPVRLPVAQQGDTVRVKVADLEKGRSLF